MSIQDTPIRDLVFPIALAKKAGTDKFEMVDFLGTGFLIGSKGFALTATHVVDISVPANHGLIGMFVDKKTNKWVSWNANVLDTHSTEDVAFLKMDGEHWQETAIRVSFEKQFSGFTYHLFGYPYTNFYEDDETKDCTGRVLGRPDLIYSTGHIRRRVSIRLPGIKGKCFYELSQPIGTGCSGSPIFKVKNGNWEVVGIYVADKTEQVVFECFDKYLNWTIRTFEMPGALAYALRMDDLSGWQPKGCYSTLDELD